MEACGKELSVQIDADGRSWALMVDLLQRYDLAAQWDGDQRLVPGAGGTARGLRFGPANLMSDA